MAKKLTQGRRLYHWRNSRGLTQRAAGQLVGVSQPIWSDWEKGTRRPDECRWAHIEEITGGAVRAADWAPDSTAAGTGA